MISSPLIAWLVEATLYGSIGVVIVLVFAPPIRRLLGARAAHLLWLLVLLRLLVPIMPASPVRWMNAVAPAASVSAPASQGKLTATARVDEVNPQTADAPPLKFPWLGLIWAAGFLALAAHAGLSLWRTNRLIDEADDVTDRGEVQLAMGRLPVFPRRLRIRETNALRSPALCGVFRPVILLPAGWMNELEKDEVHCVLAHEVGHLRRGDMLWRWVFLLARAIHWFNPLVWIAERVARVDQELACDEWVLQNAKIPGIETYGEVLLKASRVRSRHHLLVPAGAEMAESHHTLERRIHQLARFRPHRWPAFAASGMAAILLAILIGPARSDPSSPTAKMDKGPSAANVEIESKFLELSAEEASTLFPGQTIDGSSPIILSPDAFAKIIKQLSRSRTADLLSVPKVTTKPKQRASIEVTKEIPLAPGASPGEQEISLEVQPSVDDKGDIALAVTGTGNLPEPVASRKVGIVLNVEPQVNEAGTITLAVSPKVTEFEGYINYGPPLEASAAAASGTTSMQPVFAVRSLNSTVSVKNGETVVLGGFVGAGGKPEEKSESNPGNRRLLLFVTPRLIPDVPVAEPPTKAP